MATPAATFTVRIPNRLYEFLHNSGVADALDAAPQATGHAFTAQQLAAFGKIAATKPRRSDSHARHVKNMTRAELEWLRDQAMSLVAAAAGVADQDMNERANYLAGLAATRMLDTLLASATD